MERDKRNIPARVRCQKRKHETRNLEEISEDGFAFRFLFGHIQRLREIVDKVAVDVQYDSFGEIGYEDVADLLFLVPRTGAF